MGLLVYEETSPGVYTAFSVDGAFTNPITTVHHGRDGDTFEKKLYVGREDSDIGGYENIMITPDSSAGPGDLDPDHMGGTGWGVKVILDTGTDPTEVDWDATTYGAAVDTFDDITAGGSWSTPKLPFWFRIESPRGEDVSNKVSISLVLQYDSV